MSNFNDRLNAIKGARLAISVAREPYAWPGGYPRFAITNDGGALCDECCRSKISLIRQSYRGDGWRVIATDINWEDPALFCDHCGDRIESAYAEDEAA